jgi:hypothetical protein
MDKHFRIEPQPRQLDGGWDIHERDATGQWFRPGSGSPYPLFRGPEGRVQFYCTIHDCWQWITPPTTQADLLQACLEAVEKSVKPLTDAAAMMGHGQSFREAMNALAAYLKAIDRHSALCAGAGVETEGSRLYPDAVALFKQHQCPR